MKKILLALTLAAMPLPAFAAVNVEWVNPDDYRDAYSTDMKTEKSRQIILDSLEKYITEQSSRYIPEDQTLTIRVTELDLAGEFEPWRGPEAGDIRIVKSPYFAFVKLDYKLEDSEGRVLREGQETLRHFLETRVSLANRDEQAPYVRDMMDDFLRSMGHKAKSAAKNKQTAQN